MKERKLFIIFLLFLFYVILYIYFITYQIPAQHIRINMLVNKMRNAMS